MKLSAVIQRVMNDPEIDDNKRRAIISDLLKGNYSSSAGIERDIQMSEGPDTKPGGALMGISKSAAKTGVGAYELPKNLVKLAGAAFKLPGKGMEVASAISSLLGGEDNSTTRDLDALSKGYTEGVGKVTDKIAGVMPSVNEDLKKNLEYNGTAENVGGIAADIATMFLPAGMGSVGSKINKVMYANPFAGKAKALQLGDKAAGLLRNTGFSSTAKKGVDALTTVGAGAADNAMQAGAIEALRTGDMDKAGNAAAMGGILGAGGTAVLKGGAKAGTFLLRKAIDHTSDNPEIVDKLMTRLLNSEGSIADVERTAGVRARGMIGRLQQENRPRLKMNQVSRSKFMDIIQEALDRQTIPSTRYKSGGYRADNPEFTNQYEKSAEKLKEWADAIATGNGVFRVKRPVTEGMYGPQQVTSDTLHPRNLIRGIKELADGTNFSAKMLPEGDQTVKKLGGLLAETNPIAAKKMGNYLDERAIQEALKNIARTEGSGQARAEGVAVGRTLSALRSGIDPSKLGYGLTAMASPAWTSSVRTGTKAINKVDNNKILELLIRKIGVPISSSMGGNK